MEWFAVHTITYFKFDEGDLGVIPVWENIVIVRARNEASAAKKAKHESRHGLGNFGGHAEVGGHKGSIVFAGVRNVQPMFVGKDDKPDHGEEVSYIELSVKTMRQVRALAAGKRVEVVHNKPG